MKGSCNALRLDFFYSVLCCVFPMALKSTHGSAPEIVVYVGSAEGRFSRA